MTDLTADEWANRIILSLDENNAELAREERDRRLAMVRRVTVLCCTFAFGVAIGALLYAAGR
jgi:hypothetical protein